jgi:hypothetical protein
MASTVAFSSRTPAARAQVSGRMPMMHPADVKAVTSKRRRQAKLAKKETLFTSDPQSYNASSSYHSSMRAL